MGPGGQIRQFVDDLAQTHVGNSIDGICIEARRTAASLHHFLGQEGFKVSPKTVVICSNSKLAVSIKRRLARGIEITMGQVAKIWD